MIWLSEKVKSFFSSSNTFSDIMQLRGEVFRSLENRRTQKIQLGKDKYFLKQHRGIGWKEIFKNLLQLRWPILSAKNEVKAILKIQKLNILTLTISGYGWRGHHPAYYHSFLLTQALPPHITLENLVKHPISYSQKKYLIEEVARIARLLHTNGLNHRDFYLCHFIYDYNKNHIYLIDLHRAGVRYHTPMRWIIKDLAGLYFSSLNTRLTKRDYLRFIQFYTQKTLKNQNKLFWERVKNNGETLYRKLG